MTTTHADLVVVGAGLAGSAAAWAAAARGMDVVVLEAFGPGHRNGSSHGSARIFRRAYPDPLYVRLTGQAGIAWRQLESEAGESLLHVTGGLDFGTARDPAGLHALLTERGVHAELLTEASAAERWPQFDFSAAGPVMFHPEAGVLDPDRAMAAMLRLATARGADVRFNTPVTRLAASADGALAHTDSGTFAAPVIAIAAGAWLPDLLGPLVKLPPLTVTQQQIFHLAPRLAPPEPWPTFIYADKAGTFYGLPAGRDGELPDVIKLGEHDLGPITTPKTRSFTVDPEQRARFLTSALRRLPGLSTTPVNEMTCLYTSTANEDFLLDRHGPFVLASACSGHGAKFAPLLGEIIVRLAAGEPTPDPRFTLAAHQAPLAGKAGAPVV
jgi:monomeric sarcosine oxidase